MLRPGGFLPGLPGFPDDHVVPDPIVSRPEFPLPAGFVLGAGLESASAVPCASCAEAVVEALRVGLVEAVLEILLGSSLEALAELGTGSEDEIVVGGFVDGGKVPLLLALVGIFGFLELLLLVEGEIGGTPTGGIEGVGVEDGVEDEVITNGGASGGRGHDDVVDDEGDLLEIGDDEGVGDVLGPDEVDADDDVPVAGREEESGFAAGGLGVGATASWNTAPGL